MDSEHLELFYRRSAIAALWHELGIVVLIASHRKDVGEIERLAGAFLSDHDDKLRAASLPITNLPSAVLEALQTRSQDENAATALHTALQEQFEACSNAIAQIPASVDKAKGAACGAARFTPSLELAAYILPRSELADEVGIWSDRTALDRLASSAGYSSQVNSWFVSLSFLEAFSERRFASEIAEHRFDIRNLLTEAADRLERAEIFAPGINLNPDEVWCLLFATRHQSLISFIHSPVRRLVQRLLRWQTTDGWWAYDHQHRPGHFLSAVILYGLAVFGDQQVDLVKDGLRAGLRWLAQAQAPSGGWRIYDGDDHENGDVLTTAIAVELLRRTDEDSFRSEIEHGESFLLSQQTSVGFWTFHSDPTGLMTVVLESLGHDLAPIQEREGLLNLARDLMFKSEELSASHDQVDTQLCVIAAHHSVELFTYGVLTAFDPPVSFTRNDGKTVGLREALGLLEGRLRHDGELGAAQGLPLRDQLQLLANSRDAIVHQGQIVGAAQARAQIVHARRFLERQSIARLGHQILG
ncbi:MAG: prenyltransferase/squalene oxidase repeat-containing protein [Alphaproteobacteria bacterium]